MSGRLFIGTSGYQYQHWKGRFYPPELPTKRWIEHYMRHFDTLELNRTYYKLPSPETVDAWRVRAPRGFTYAVKYSHFATHRKKLKDPEEPIERFTNLVCRLQETLGPILVQLPPRFHANAGRLAEFLQAVPKQYRWAIEFRDPTWLNEAIFSLLEKCGVALCIHDMVKDHPRRVTATFTYLRYHGQGYGGRYSAQSLSAEARRIRRSLRHGVDVYAYFNNDREGHAVNNALTLRCYLERGEGTPPACTA
jgi:uncharacterized protein YecE (DUF72 family)